MHLRIFRLAEITGDPEKRIVTRLPPAGIEIEFVKNGFDRHGKADTDRIFDDHRVYADYFAVHVD